MLPFTRRVVCRRRDISRAIYTLAKQEPPKSAPRIAPYPLVWVSTTDWDPHSRLNPHVFPHFLKQGFTCLHADISTPKTPLDAPALMRYYESELKAALDEEHAGAAPVIFASGLATLVAQTYISSHPAMAMALFSPPARISDVSFATGELSEFNYEPKFPIALVGSSEGMAQHRLGQDPYVDRFAFEADSSEVVTALSEWMDECGI
ncbi:hypothetical protein CYLTODRAFT_417526 [Cylindrobasidium torrendii FP15055 ss-10]|uniref:Serine hydrolase FSH domain-containing protein n=1 Tax=Cylindrobasidium torrendii FP15055 ss-10 TaxID=1314674 RepID=A0A0D7BT21_9AGAR|nr:hypothetical protein CYLTODRAFT_417526 [Cylindrobasidium torrendii FP15055 ss-10]